MAFKCDYFSQSRALFRWRVAVKNLGTEDGKLKRKVEQMTINLLEVMNSKLHKMFRSF